LEHSWGHEADFEDKKRALQEAICTTLFGVATSYQRAFLLYGVGGTGKSVLMDIISAMVPEASTSSIKPTQWDGRWEKAMFGKSLLNQAGELSEREFIDGTMFKQIVVGEVITGEFKGGQLFQLRPKTAHWFASNYLPKTKDHSEGFNRRWLIFNFNRVVAPEDRIIDLANKIVYEEIEMIVAWALEAWPALVKREGYTLCASHKDKVKDMALQNSSIRQWMSERVILNVAGAKVDEKTLYSDFWKFSMQAMGAKVLQPKTFNIEFNQFLGEIGIEQGVSTGQGVIMYKDIALVKD
jgi:P4 family phage/plasmid primase-like protien